MARILIVDDDEVLTKLYLNKLHAEGHAVDYAEDGEKAATFLSNKYDLIVLDVMVPRIDGLSLLARARSGVNAKVPILIYTNLPSDDTKKRALELKATDVLFKADFTPFTFIDTINKYIN